MAILITRCLVFAFMGWLCLLNSTGCAPKRVSSRPVRSDPVVVPAAESESAPAPAPAPMPAPTPAPNQPSGYDVGLAAASLAIEQIGKTYQYGSEGPGAFDCSGLVFFVFGSQGINLPRTARDQARVGRQIAENQLIPGDLLFFALDGDHISHVGIYIGRGDFVHAPSAGKVVCKESLDSSWWDQRMRVIRRVF